MKNSVYTALKNLIFPFLINKKCKKCKNKFVLFLLAKPIYLLIK